MRVAHAEADAESLPIEQGGCADEFVRRHFPRVTQRQWNDWRWQLRHRVTSLAELAHFVDLSEEELAAGANRATPLPISVTPYYLSLVSPDDPTDPIRRCVIPSADEQRSSRGEADDPLNEDHDSPVPGLVHRYPDRVLFLVTSACSTYCRYCTRSRLVGDGFCGTSLKARWQAGIDYIRSNPAVKDVIVSGGDPLIMQTSALEWILDNLRRIPHVEIIRIGTKVPAVLPQRITPSLVSMLRRYQPLWMSLHFTHPGELTPETALACERLADAGLPLGSQTVLLKGINDRVETLTALFRGLLRHRVRPYYLYQCDPITGSAHFRTPVSRGIEMIQGLRGHISGYAVPSYVIDAPGGGGKTPVLPEYVLGREDGDVVLRNWAGGVYRYPDCGASAPGERGTIEVCG